MVEFLPEKYTNHFHPDFHFLDTMTQLRPALVDPPPLLYRLRPVSDWK